MPYSVDNPPDVVKKLSPKKQRQWIHVWNSAYEAGKSEPTCFKEAWGVVNSSVDSRFERIVANIVRRAADPDPVGEPIAFDDVIPTVETEQVEKLVPVDEFVQLPEEKKELVEQRADAITPTDVRVSRVVKAVAVSAELAKLDGYLNDLITEDYIKPLELAISEATDEEEKNRLGLLLKSYQKAKAQREMYLIIFKTAASVTHRTVLPKETYIEIMVHLFERIVEKEREYYKGKIDPLKQGSSELMKLMKTNCMGRAYQEAERLKEIELNETSSGEGTEDDEGFRPNVQYQNAPSKSHVEDVFEEEETVQTYRDWLKYIKEKFPATGSYGYVDQNVGKLSPEQIATFKSYGFKVTPDKKNPEESVIWIPRWRIMLDMAKFKKETSDENPDKEIRRSGLIRDFIKEYGWLYPFTASGFTGLFLKLEEAEKNFMKRYELKNASCSFTQKRARAIISAVIEHEIRGKVWNDGFSSAVDTVKELLKRK